jgi:hypothetical protein
MHRDNCWSGVGTDRTRGDDMKELPCGQHLSRLEHSTVKSGQGQPIPCWWVCHTGHLGAPGGQLVMGTTLTPQKSLYQALAGMPEYVWGEGMEGSGSLERERTMFRRAAGPARGNLRAGPRLG